MNDLKVLGTERIGNFEFTGIEGGFGKNKKAMLVKDIATIHNRPVFKINQLITDNIKRFKTNIDLIDLLNTSGVFRKFAEDNGLIGSNRTQHVYLLSERGYAKLLKILEDDKAWEIYDELVDNYFNMRQSIKQYKLPQTFSEALIELAKEVKKNEVLKPKAERYDRYLSNKGLITITEIAKEYGMSGRELNKFLHEKGVIYKRGSKWFIYQKYANERYVGYEIHLPEGRRSLKWTPEGEMFIRELLENNNIKPVLEQPQQLTVQETVKYSGKYYTASSIAYNLGLSEEWIMKIGEIANNLKLKPRFSDENIYCRKTLDDNGFPRWEYTQYGAALIENEINKFRLANQI
ncbi:phage antirepressor KilAC domain-containing protein [Ligilactobacillus salivarius]|uniref:phage antirepressor KilAC domain-containing protein n=1 Tax=Ligilactobacillus salivarius TaxID=1624 RepID=UPI000BAE8ECC